MEAISSKVLPVCMRI